MITKYNEVKYLLNFCAASISYYSYDLTNGITWPCFSEGQKTHEIKKNYYDLIALFLEFIMQYCPCFVVAVIVVVVVAVVVAVVEPTTRKLTC